MVDTRKKFPDIAFEHILVAPRKVLKPLDGPVRALAQAVGVRVVDKRLLEYRLDHVAQGVMYHPVAKGRGADQALLGVVHVKCSVGTGGVDFGLEVALQTKKFRLQPELKCGYLAFVPLTFARAVKCRQQIIEIRYLFKKAVMTPHGDSLIINKTRDFLKDLIPILARFPKHQRFFLGDRMQNILTDTLEMFIEAYYISGEAKKEKLKQANIYLEKLRQFNRICYEMGFYTSLKFQELGRRIDEIGRMNGGWLKSLS